jgi:hypothetical protein
MPGASCNDWAELGLNWTRMRSSVCPRRTRIWVDQLTRASVDTRHINHADVDAAVCYREYWTTLHTQHPPLQPLTAVPNTFALCMKSAAVEPRGHCARFTPP